ncbi:hypothetical protein B0H13DRAFT_1885162 [Mycena leptocephala]|nr:hypothetical protein B0H13DRAFT_1885162 [Mycena leptocephala]
MEIIAILQERVVTHGNTTALELKDLYGEFQGAFQGVLVAVRELQNESRGLRGHLAEYINSRGITDEIACHEKRIQALCSKLKLMVLVETSFKVHEMHATMFSLNNDSPVLHAPQNTNNCPPPSRIFQGWEKILRQMHQYFTRDLGKQHVYLLHGLGGAGKTQIALKFIQESSHFTDIFFLDASTSETIDMPYELSGVKEFFAGCIEMADDPQINLLPFSE